MKLTTTKVQELTFSVESFEAEEGGMDHQLFGKDCSELAEVVEQLDLAKIAHPKYDWVIVCRVTTKINGNAIK